MNPCCKSRGTGEQRRRPDPLLDVRLGDYRTAAHLEQREQGFPVYLDGEFFVSLAHPAAWATAEGGQVRLVQHPGTTLRRRERSPAWRPSTGWDRHRVVLERHSSSMSVGDAARRAGA